MKLSIIAPMFNEEENVSSTVERIEEVFKDFSNDSWELILVNDGSTDKTLTNAENLANEKPFLRIVTYSQNAGRGHALRRGFDSAQGEIILSTDFDLSYHPSHLLKLYEALNNDPELDAVLGSAYMRGGSAVGVPFIRLAVSKLGNCILSYALGGQVKTVTCILRGYRRRALDALDLESDGKEIHLEILSKLLALGFRVKEIPAKLEARQKGKSKFRLKKTSVTHLLFTFAERPMMLFGLLGFFCLAMGLSIGTYFWAQEGVTLGRPLFSLVILLILGGVQILCFGFLAVQVSALRKELYRIQKSSREISRKLS